MPRPPIKKTRVLARAAEKGRLRAQRDAEFFGIPQFFRSFFKGRGHKERCITAWKWINDKVKDIPKGVAIIGMTLLVKKVIDTSEDIRAEVKKIVGPTFIWEREYWSEPFASWFFGTDLGAEGPGKFEGMFPDWADWIIAFSLAYVIIEHGGELFRAFGGTVQSLTSVVRLLVGLG